MVRERCTDNFRCELNTGFSVTLSLGGQLQMETQLLDRHMFWVVRMYNLAKFARLHKTQNGNMCKVDHPASSYNVRY